MVNETDAVSDFLSTWERAPGRRAGAAENHLCRADPRLTRIIKQAGPQRFGKSNARSHFDAIARSIIYQQISKKAAAAIYSRYLNVLASDPEPRQVLRIPPSALRSVGLSASKVRYLKALASAVASGEIDLDRIAERSDEQIIQELTRLPGIGLWTAQMFLMFRLQRLDVLPTRDLGIRRGLQLVYALGEPAAPGYLAKVGEKWSPYRSIASLYLWTAVDLNG
ncbi:MAG: DNA-3-methyladenine glycosylase 2 family protein [Deltaproteobacteria bacterium]|nr:DNA-3-methyladenine glycosylase 2 family protein [Deltaproteobacteria bacterium]